jgi:hypothetical protein
MVAIHGVGEVPSVLELRPHWTTNPPRFEPEEFEPGRVFLR